MACAAIPLPPERRGTIPGLRWVLCGLLFVVTCLNYVDRVTLTVIKDDILVPRLGWTEVDFGWTVFSLQTAYAIGFVLAGRWLDRFGVRRGLALGVLVWSLAAMGHSLASTVLGFAAARFVLGLGEATNFPAAIKTVAEWFPRRERALATGIFNTGTNVGAALQGPLLLVALSPWGPGSLFIGFGLCGLLWIAAWLWLYRSPADHPRLSREEAARIAEDLEPPAASVDIPWPCLLRYRQAWAFCLGKMLTDPVWWFFLYWMPTYLKAAAPSRTSALWALAVIYFFADAGSIFGGWLAGRFQRAGWTASRARLTALSIFATLMPATLLLDSAALAVLAPEWRLVLTVGLLSLVTGAHQGWSANIFTVASDAFPKEAVGSVVGFGAMCGAVGGMFMPLVAGAVLTTQQGRYASLFLMAGVLHPASFVAIRLLTGRTIERIDVDHLRISASPALRALGLAAAALGALGALAIGRRWNEIAASAEGTRGAAAASMVLAAALMVALIGLALLYASREQRPAARAA
jgi:ACS family hexuronate transporter-like MFS transporter